MKESIILLSLFCFTLPGTGQSFISDFTLRPKVGANISYPMGKSISALKSTDKEWESSSTDENSYSGNLVPIIGLNAGLELAYKIFSDFELSIGIQFSKMGHKHREQYLYNDENFQYDAELKVTNTYQFGLWKIPLSATWDISGQWSISGGANIAWVQDGKSARYRSKREFNVIINGEKDMEESEPKTTQETKLSPLLRKTIPGLFLGISFPLPKGFSGYLDIERTSNVFTDKNTEVTYLSARLGISYPLSFN